MANKKIKHIVAKLLGETTEETLDIYDESALHATDIVDNLTSNDATKVLSAKQGKALNDSITRVQSGSVTINTTYVTSVGDNWWRIQNGVATVYVGNILFKKTQNNAQVFSGLPRARVQVGAVISSSSYQNNKALYTSGDCLWIPTNSTTAYAHIGTGMLNVGIWAYFTYLTSD